MNDSSAGADIALTAGVLVTGKTGSGKTSTSKRQIEDLCAYRAHGWEPGMVLLPRVCILDPIKSDWWGITLSADGRRPALPFVILGGPHGHVPLSDTAGTAIGEIVASGQLPMCILDMAYFKMGGLQRFFCDFAEALFRKNRGPLHLVLEEAHEFAPKERSGASGENMAVYWSKKLATAGRSKGLRLMLATQATQSLHNSLMGACETLLAHRMTLPAHIEPVTKWLSSHLSKDGVEKIRADMPKLSNGQAYIVHEGYVERRQFKMMQTFDNTKTPDGSEIDAAPPPVDRAKLLEIVGQAVKEAEENDVDTLKARIAALQSGNSGEYTMQAYEEARAASYRNGFQNGEASAMKHAGRLFSDCILPDTHQARNAFQVLLSSIESIEHHVRSGLDPDAAARAGDKTDTVRPAPPPSGAAASSADIARAPAPTPATPRRVSKAEAAPGSSVIGDGSGRRLFGELEKYFRANVSFSMGEMLIVAGMRNGGYFARGKKWLLDNEYIRATTTGYEITMKGEAKLGTLGDQQRKKLTRELIGEIWLPRLERVATEVLRVMLRDRHSLPIPTAHMQQLVGIKGGGYWNRGLKSLRDTGIIDTQNGIRFTSFVHNLP